VGSEKVEEDDQHLVRETFLGLKTATLSQKAMLVLDTRRDALVLGELKEKKKDDKTAVSCRVRCFDETQAGCGKKKGRQKEGAKGIRDAGEMGDSRSKKRRPRAHADLLPANLLTQRGMKTVCHWISSFADVRVKIW